MTSSPGPFLRTDSRPPSGGPRRHPLIVPAFVAALIPCCPPAGLLGAMLGIFALRRIRLQPDRYHGAKAAILAVIIGCAHAVVTAGLLQYVARQQRGVQLDAARETLARVLGDAEARDAFAAGSGVRAEDLERFRAHVREDYGTYERFMPAIVTPGGSVLQPQLDIAGSFVFDGRSVPGAARFDVTVQSTSLRPVMRLQWLRIGDDSDGRIGPAP